MVDVVGVVGIIGLVQVIHRSVCACVMVPMAERRTYEANRQAGPQVQNLESGPNRPLDFY